MEKLSGIGCYCPGDENKPRELSEMERAVSGDPETWGHGQASSSVTPGNLLPSPASSLSLK